MFDFTPLTTQSLTLAVVAFAVSYFAIGLVQRWGWLRAAKNKPIVSYAGALLVATTILGAALILRHDMRLTASLIAASFVVLLGGIWDEERRLSPGRQLLLQVGAAGAAVLGGWTIKFISQPVGNGVIVFDPWLGGMLAIGWLLLLMNAVNWLDGVDGLAPSVALIALVTLAAISVLPSVQNSTTLDLSLAGAAAVGGFLLWNWPPARVYLGTSGSWFLGLYIGLVAIYGGGKIVTTLLVLALPVVDVLLVSLLRVLAGRKPWQGDTTRHLHHRLLHYGFSHRAITLMAVGLSIALAVGAILLQTRQKIIALAITAATLLIAGAVLAILNAKARRISPKIVIALVVAGVAVGWLGGLVVQRPCRNFAESSVTIGSTTWSVAVADNPVEHSRGLMECASVPNQSGMYFVFKQPSTQPFWMKSMQLPLDLVWIRETEIIGIEANVPPAGSDPNPPRYWAPQPYTAVLEIPAGEAQHHGLAAGQGVAVD